MVVGLCTVELFLPDGHSLKAKRQALSSLKSRLRGHFNIAVAEVEDHELWQRAVLGIVCIANETSRANQVLDQVLNAIRANPSMELLKFRIEML